MVRGDRLPALILTDRTGAPFSLRAPERGSIVLFAPHSPACEGCRSYLAALGGLDHACRIWDARRVAVVRGEASDLDEQGFAVVPDADGAVSRRLGTDEAATLVIADRFGEVYEAVRVEGTRHGDLPSTTEIEEWLTFLGTQCPECGVPDEPGLGAWADPPS